MEEIIKIVVFVEEILSYFTNIKKGLYSDIVWYELLRDTGGYLKDKNNKNFIEYLDFTLNIQKKDIVKIEKNYLKRIKEVKKNF